MSYKLEIAQGSDRLREKSVSLTEVALDVAPPVLDAPARVDETGVELKRGAFLNTIAMVAPNFRGLFTFLVARVLGPAATRNLDTDNHREPSPMPRNSRDEDGTAVPDTYLC